MVAFGLPDVPRKPLPGAVSKAVAAWAAGRRGLSKVGAFTPAVIPRLRHVDKTSGTGFLAVDVVTGGCCDQGNACSGPVQWPVDGH